MIFYFTGTGNSLAAAKAVAAEGEQLVNMAEARQKRAFRYAVPEKEPVGFFFPEYCATIGDTVLDFVRNLELKHGGYVYAVITSGGGKQHGGALLKKALAARGIKLCRVFCVHMPDNAVMYLPVPNEQKKAELLRRARIRCTEIRGAVRRRETKPIRGIMAQLCQPMYHLANTTRPYHADERCTGCGKCAKNCPDKAIQMKDGKPQWVKTHCTLCAACINRCPVHAIGYGKDSEKRGRYVHPDFR